MRWIKARPSPFKATTIGSITGSAYLARSLRTTWKAKAATARRLDWNQKSLSNPLSELMLTRALAPMPTASASRMSTSSTLRRGLGAVSVWIILPPHRESVRAKAWGWQWPLYLEFEHLLSLTEWGKEWCWGRFPTYCRSSSGSRQYAGHHQGPRRERSAEHSVDRTGEGTQHGGQ